MGYSTDVGSGSGGGGVTDHGALTGLADDDHDQYVLNTGDTINGQLVVNSSVFSRVTAGNVSWALRLDTDANERFYFDPSGRAIYFGDGTLAADTKLHRPSADTLATDDYFVANSPSNTIPGIRTGIGAAFDSQVSASIAFLGFGIDHGSIAWKPAAAAANEKFQFLHGGGTDPTSMTPFIGFSADDKILFGSAEDIALGRVEAETLRLIVPGQSRYGRLQMGSFFSTYTSDGVFNANAEASQVQTPSDARLIFGYHDNGGGQYIPSIGFNWDIATVAQALNILQSRGGLGTGPDTVNRWQVDQHGKISWGPGGSTAVDTDLFRGAAGRVETTGTLRAQSSLQGPTVFANQWESYAGALPLTLKGPGGGLAIADFRSNTNVVRASFPDAGGLNVVGQITQNGAKNVLDTDHTAAGDPHTGYRLESADHSHASSGLQGGQVAHSVLTGIGDDDHHNQLDVAEGYTGLVPNVIVTDPAYLIFDADRFNISDFGGGETYIDTDVGVNDLADYDGGAFTDGDILVYHSSDSLWHAEPPAAPGGGGLTMTAFTKDLGVSRTSGTFDITGLSGLTANKVVLIQQTAAQIASKGNARDEPEMDHINVTGYVVDATTIRAYWDCKSVVVGTYAFAYAVSG